VTSGATPSDCGGAFGRALIARGIDRFTGAGQRTAGSGPAPGGSGRRPGNTWTNWTCGETPAHSRRRSAVLLAGPLDAWLDIGTRSVRPLRVGRTARGCLRRGRMRAWRVLEVAVVPVMCQIMDLLALPNAR